MGVPGVIQNVVQKCGTGSGTRGGSSAPLMVVLGIIPGVVPQMIFKRSLGHFYTYKGGRVGTKIDWHRSLVGQDDLFQKWRLFGHRGLRNNFFWPPPADTSLLNSNDTLAYVLTECFEKI